MEIIIGDYKKCMRHCDELFGGDYFSFSLSYVHPEEPFRELARFIWDSRHRKSPFKNYFEGNLILDITAWCGRPNEYLEAFLYYLKDNEDKITCAVISEREIDHETLSAFERLWDISITDHSPAADTMSIGTPKTIGFSTAYESNEKEDKGNVRG